METNVIIAPTLYISEIQKKLSGAKLFNTKMLSVGQARDYYFIKDLNEVDIKMQYRERLKKYEEDFPYCLEIEFIDELYKVVRDIKFNNKQNEITSIAEPFKSFIKEVIDIEIDIDRFHSAVKKIKEASDSIQYIKATYNKYDAKFLELLGAKELELEYIPEKSEIDLIKFKNMKEELEYIAQNHIDNFTDVKIVMMDNAYLPMIYSIFNRYNIPVSSAIYPYNSKIQKLYNNALNYVQLRDYNLLVEVNFFKQKEIDKVAQYLKLIKLDTELDNVEELPRESVITTLTSKEVLQEVEDFRNNVNKFNEKIEQGNLRELLKFIDMHVREHVVSDIDNNMLVKIQEILFNYENYSSIDNLGLYITLINNLKTSNIQENAIQVYNWSDKTPYKQYCYIVGCTSENYPGFKISKNVFTAVYKKLGLIDEEKEYKKLQKDLLALNKSANKVVYSYPKMTLQGKKLYSGFFSFDFDTKDEKTISQRDYRYRRDYSMNKAEELYLIDGKHILKIVLYGVFRHIEKEQQDGVEISRSLLDKFFAGEHTTEIEQGINLLLNYVRTEELTSRFKKEFTVAKEYYQ